MKTITEVAAAAAPLLPALLDPAERTRLDPEQRDLAALVQLRASLTAGGAEAVQALPEGVRDAMAEALNYACSPSLYDPVLLAAPLTVVTAADPHRAAKLAALNAVALAWAADLDTLIVRLAVRGSSS
ncbi:hypothetical protein [Deinococcus sp. SL84]|uniref:hypothetical protein n=1 Tax=Deinococcus sp. SL84 TaxID=2994663 RepID=UPI002273B5B0|nr:hypothetical protein [Deinococcus sp. SL84]MCY1703601.1 hypothetical protein [Deinococcus sp. SL84]